jgi:hypothetical protein
VFLLVQYTDGNVVATTYNCASDTLKNGAETQVTLGKTTKGAAKDNQGAYVGQAKTVNGVDDATQSALKDKTTALGTTNLCPVNFQPS